ncbi:hypothetical protein HOE425_333083 [Hoeflea sp. EC-HK425]|nr:hypothetical protein HOE425_333083 [Hoeflea sp. EC-HK425]
MEYREKRRPVQGAFEVRIGTAESASGFIPMRIAALIVDHAAVFLQFQPHGVDDGEHCGQRKTQQPGEIPHILILLISRRNENCR